MNELNYIDFGYPNTLQSQQVLISDFLLYYEMHSAELYTLLSFMHMVVCYFQFCVISISSVGDNAQEFRESISLEGFPLDIVCNVVEIVEHVKILQCVGITNPLEVCQLYASLCALSLLHPCHTYT